MMQIIFTDLDGTLLDNKYSFRKAAKALKLVKQNKIPLVLCTSKSRLETVYWQRKLKINHPFVVENGGAAVIPKGYFGNKKQKIIKLGSDKNKLKKILKKIEKKTNSKIIYRSEMPVKELQKSYGMSLNEARISKKKDYIEPFLIVKGSLNAIKRLIKKNKLNYTKAKRFHYLMGSNDKGKAVKILTGLYRKKYGKVVSIGLGDNLNDKPMLKAVDKGFLLKKGPAEWNKIIIKYLEENGKIAVLKEGIISVHKKEISPKLRSKLKRGVTVM